MRASRRIVSGLLALAIVSVATAPSTSWAAVPPLNTVFPAPDPTVSAELNVTAIFAGVNLTAAEKTSLAAKINATWTPIVSSLEAPVGIAYALHVRLVDASDAFTRAYAGALASSFSNDTLGRHVGNYVGLLANLTAAFPSYEDLTPVRHAPAEDAAFWLATAAGDFPEVGGAEGEARFFFLNPYLIGEPYYYAVNSSELDRGSNFTYETVNAWGDGAGVFFQDLRAAPSHLGEGSTGRPGNFAGQPPIWSYGSSAPDRARLIADLAYYIETSVRILVAPSLVVTPFDATSYTLAVTIFDNTAAQTLFAPGGAGSSFGINRVEDLLNVTLIAEALRNLVPYSGVTVTVAKANRSSDPTTASALSRSTSTAGSANVINPFTLSNDLRTRWAVPTDPIEPGDAVRLPALLVVLDSETWVDSLNVRGVTLQRNDGRAAGIVIAGSLAQLSTRAFSETLIHEGGHGLGLGHPHEVWQLAANGSSMLELDWLRSSTSTPMTYLPNYVDYSFDEFDRHALWSGVAAETLRAAYELRNRSYALLDARGYTTSDLPAGTSENETLFSSYGNATQALLSRGILYIEAVPPYSSGGAIVMAKRAYDQAKELYALAAASPICCGDGIRPLLPLTIPLLVAVVLVIAIAAALARRPRR